MNDTKIISKSYLMSKADQKIKAGIKLKPTEMCNIVTPVLQGRTGTINDRDIFDLAMNARQSGRENAIAGDLTKKYGSAFDVPRFCVSKNKKMTVREMLQARIYTDPKMSSNSITPDWQSLWDALRIDISIRKSAMGAIRDSFYNITDMPESSKVFKSTEFNPYAIVFEENNGEGQSISQGESMAGQYESIEHLIYAAGFSFTLLAELFEKSMDAEKITDAVMVGHDAKRDDVALSPIISFAYGGNQQTPASAVGTDRQEKLYSTLEDAVDNLSDRVDPVTGRKIDASDLRILASPLDARHIGRVINGLPSTNERSLPSISEITEIGSYDGETITGRSKTTTYSGVTNGKVYLVKKNRHMNIGVKRNLTLEIDQTPDTKTLAREKRSWYYAEGIQTTGIASFVQEITLPAW